MSDKIKAALESMKEQRDAYIKDQQEKNDAVKKAALTMESTMAEFVEDVHEELKKQTKDLMQVYAPIRVKTSLPFGGMTYPPVYEWNLVYDDFKSSQLVAEMSMANEIDLYRRSQKSPTRYKCKRTAEGWTYSYPSAYNQQMFYNVTLKLDSLSEVVEKVLLEMIHNMEHEKAVFKNDEIMKTFPK